MKRFKVKVDSREYIVEVEELKEEYKEEKHNTSKLITAPMAGNIVKINCSVGQEIKKGQVLFILEAMKMQNEIVASKDGTIKVILVSKGQIIKSKEPLLEYEE